MAPSFLFYLLDSVLTLPTSTPALVAIKLGLIFAQLNLAVPMAIALYPQ